MSDLHSEFQDKTQSSPNQNEQIQSPVLVTVLIVVTVKYLIKATEGTVYFGSLV